MAGQFDFKLDTSAFTESAEATKNLAETLEGAIAKTDKAINNLYDVWVGEGRNEFEKKYKIFEQQVADIKNGLWDLYEDIKPILMQLRRWMVYQRAVYPLVIIN